MDLKLVFPGLDFDRALASSTVTTKVHLIDGGNIIDEYSIEVVFDRFYPKSFPLIFERENRIPPQSNRHKNQDESCCIIVEDQKWEYSTEGKCDLKKYFEGPVRNYFLSQAIFEISGKWIFGEQKHYWPGVLDYYRKITGFEDIGVIVDFVSLASQSKVSGHHLCPCKSGKKIRECHIDIVTDLHKRVPSVRLLEVAKKLPTEATK